MRLRGSLMLVLATAWVGLLAPPTSSEEPAAAGKPPAWKSLAIPEAQGTVTEEGGKKVQLRYAEAPFNGVTQFWGDYRTYAYDDARTVSPPAQAGPPAGATGDAARGRKIFMDRGKGPCTGCHLIQGEDVWPAGNIGTDLSNYGDRDLPDEFVYQVIFDPRVLYPQTGATMPPWGAMKVLKPEEIVDLVAFLKTQKSPVPPEKDPNRNANTRMKPVGFGDNLDPTNNPAVVYAESALAVWNAKGPKHKSCNSCHKGELAKAMKGIAAKYPLHVAKYGRVMSIEDYLEVHGPETTGLEFPSEGDANLNMTMLVKMASNGMPLGVDVTSPEAKAALARGKASFYKKVGQRNHACADCHTVGQGKGGNRFLGGRLLVDVESGLTRHFPTFRTNFQVVWDIRKRMQWCMLPLGMNILPSDSVEYAELELYLTSFDNGKPLNVPGIRH